MYRNKGFGELMLISTRQELGWLVSGRGQDGTQSRSGGPQTLSRGLIHCSNVGLFFCFYFY